LFFYYFLAGRRPSGLPAHYPRHHVLTCPTSSFRCVDTANLEELATLVHEDVTVHFMGGTYE
jgi:hypothetical protein